eukprot:1241179-Rhodomonas_salina.1
MSVPGITWQARRPIAGFTWKFNCICFAAAPLPPGVGTRLCQSRTAHTHTAQDSVCQHHPQH